MAVDRARVQALVHELLVAIGEDPARPGLVRTPERVAEAYAEIFSGIDRDPAEPLAQPIAQSSASEPDIAASGAVVLRDIQFRSVCEHHLLLFRGVAHIAYLPRERIVGFGALPRVVDILASRPQVQERLGEQIADAIADGLDARGVLVVLEAVHGCLTMRGERHTNTAAITVAARGELAEPAARAELIALIGSADS